MSLTGRGNIIRSVCSSCHAPQGGVCALYTGLCVSVCLCVRSDMEPSGYSFSGDYRECVCVRMCELFYMCIHVSGGSV